MSGTGPVEHPVGGPADQPADGLGDAARPGSGQVTATVIVNAPAERVFAAFLAWEKQSEWIPFTTVTVVEGDGGEGSLVLAVTAVGPAAVRDEIRVVRIDAPYEVRVVHCGTILRGPGSLRCTPMDGGRTQVVLHEWFQLPDGVAGRVAWPLLWPGSKVGFTQALKKFGRLVEQGRLP
jgi:uncharacterized protein YndB with AHSA1/START domain